MAQAIANMDEMDEEEFADKLNALIYIFPGNYNKTLKTINNWRTEISSLFGFFIFDEGKVKPGLRAKELAKNEDLVESFKVFLYNFQYPGGHIKAHEVCKLIEEGVHFKPAQYILRLLRYAEEFEKKRAYITKPEFTHCIMNDLRCTRDNQDVSEAWNRIKHNRELQIEYDTTGDVIRYAGDILDYMEISNLMVTYDNSCFYINKLEEEAVLKFVNSTEWFDGYDSMIKSRKADISLVNKVQRDWFIYVNRDLSETDFQTDILAFISKDEDEYQALKKSSLLAIAEKITGEGEAETKDIGDLGESMVYGHECERLKAGGREDLVHIVHKIPTYLAVGYDIQSVELDARKRYIEVKTTISSKPLHFNKVHLTTNEWHSADTLRDRYFIYRLMVSKVQRKLFLIQDPVGLYKKDLLQMNPKDGADIVFDTNSSGHFEELLSWAN
jgi:Ca2+-binding EF-hand superfamily protein